MQTAAEQSVQRAPDAGGSAHIPSSFLRLIIIPWTVRPGQAGWTASPSPPQRRACALKGISRENHTGRAASRWALVRKKTCSK